MWEPSRREQHAEWYLRLFMRYVIGGGGLVWEVAFDKLHNTLALIVFGALGTSTDVIRYGRSLVDQAKAEQGVKKDEAGRPPDDVIRQAQGETE